VYSGEKGCVPDHDQPAAVTHFLPLLVLFHQPPRFGDVQYPGWGGLGRLEIPCDDGVELFPRQEFGEEVVDGGVEIAGADPLGEGFGLEVGHESAEAGLGLSRDGDGDISGLAQVNGNAEGCRQRWLLQGDVRN